MIKKCEGCGMVSDCGWIENPSKDYACVEKNVPHRWVPLFWVRNVPGDRAKREVP